MGLRLLIGLKSLLRQYGGTHGLMGCIAVSRDSKLMAGHGGNSRRDRTENNRRRTQLRTFLAVLAGEGVCGMGQLRVIGI